MAKKAKRVKAGTGKKATAARKARFVSSYIANGGNATQAAIEAGYSAKRARATGAEFVADRNIAAKIAEVTEKAAEKSGLSVERTLREIARLAYADPRRLYDEAGQLIPIHKLDEETAATIASVEVNEIAAEGVVIGQTKKLKVWDKNAALEKAMKYHGLYEKDNAQKPVKVIFVEGLDAAL